MHAFRSSRRRLQRLVWLTLLAWSLALASGVVNACVLGLPARTAEGSSPPAHAETATHGRSSQDIGAHDAEHQRAGASDSHPHEQGHGTSGKDTCLKFCADESSALAKNGCSAVDMAAALLDLHVGRRLAVACIGADLRSRAEPPRAQGPPLVIRFLRLTL